MFTFDTFEVGEEIGHCQAAVTPEDVANWLRLYGGEAPPYQGVPWGLVSAICMKSYLTVVSPRPPGNIHTKQYYKVFDRPKILQDITASVACAGKERRNNRLIVSFKATLSSTVSEKLIMIGTSTMLWAR